MNEMTMQMVTETIQPASSPSDLTLERRYASRDDGIAGDLTIAKEDSSRSERFSKLTGRIVVRWSGRHARGWGKAYRATFALESEARAFAATKWETIKAWIAKQPPAQDRAGAAEAFSAMVADMSAR